MGRRFCEWLRQKYGSQAKLEAAWGGRPAFDCFRDEGFPTDGEQLDKDNILPLGNPWFWDPDQLNGSQAFRKQRLLDSLHFLYQLQCEFFERYVQALREAGYQGEILSSNWQAGRAYSHFANLHADYLVGTIDRHNYFGGDQANASMLARAGSGMLSSGMQQVADRPFMLSEWIHVFPNEMGVEGPAIIGAYGMGLQGWDVSFMFQNRDDGTFSSKIGRDQWDVTAPQVLGVFPAVARQIHRGDVQQSDLTVTRNVHVPSLFEGKLSFDDTVAQGYDDKELDSKQGLRPLPGCGPERGRLHRPVHGYARLRLETVPAAGAARLRQRAAALGRRGRRLAAASSRWTRPAPKPSSVSPRAGRASWAR